MYPPSLNLKKLKNNLALYHMDSKGLSNSYKTTNNIWIYGKPGIGKTYYATTHFRPFYWKNLTKWWDGYNGEINVLIDDLDTKSKEIAHYLKIWADNYGFIGEVKMGTIPINFERLIVTSNFLPDELFDSVIASAITRRFNFYTITGKFPNFQLVNYIFDN